MTHDEWKSQPAPYLDDPKTVFDWIRILRRGAPVVLLILICLPIMGLIKSIETVIGYAHSPISGFFPKFVSRCAVLCFGLKVEVNGQPMRYSGAVVANHTSWLDIFVMNAFQRILFVSKSEVAKWPGIGVMARATGTIFINRSRGQIAQQNETLSNALNAGSKLLFFPEGTSTDGLRLQSFKPALFQSVIESNENNDLYVQPVSAKYNAPKGRDPRFYGWWGDLEFLPSLLSILAQKTHGKITLTFHEPIAVSQHEARKELAKKAESVIRTQLGF